MGLSIEVPVLLGCRLFFAGICFGWPSVAIFLTSCALLVSCSACWRAFLCLSSSFTVFLSLHFCFHLPFSFWFSCFGFLVSYFVWGLSGVFCFAALFFSTVCSGLHAIFLLLGQGSFLAALVSAFDCHGLHAFFLSLALVGLL